jgi:hypothetical protein
VPFKQDDPAVYFQAVFDKTKTSTPLVPVMVKPVDKWRGMHIMRYGHIPIKRQYNRKLNCHTWWVIDAKGNKQITDYIVTSELDAMFMGYIEDTGFLKAKPNNRFRA